MSTITKQEIESDRGKLDGYPQNSKRHTDLTHALSRAEAWMRSAKEIQKSLTEDLEAAFEKRRRHEGSLSAPDSGGCVPRI